LERKEVPTFEKALPHGIKWKPEPPGDEHFDHAKTVLARKWGDCDDLAPWQAASLRHTGEDPGAKAVAKRSGLHRRSRRGRGVHHPAANRSATRARRVPSARGSALVLGEHLDDKPSPTDV